MRIMLDKIEKPPEHALTRDEVKRLLDAAPPDWLRYVHTVHLGATLPSHGRFNRPVILSNHPSRLNVYCRGLTPDSARREILRELAQRSLNRSRNYNKLSAQELKDIDALIAPVLEAVMEAEKQIPQPEEGAS